MFKNEKLKPGTYGIDHSIVRKSMIAAWIWAFFTTITSLLCYWMVIIISREDEVEVSSTVTTHFIIWTLVIDAIIILLTKPFSEMYYRNFSYEISDKFIIIRHGILTRTKSTIPFSRIQNIAIHRDIRDRILNIYTVKIETAGSSGIQGGNSGAVRPEGYIPGVKDPTEIENIIQNLVNKYTQQSPEGLKDNIFQTPNETFDEFIAYILSKIRTKAEISNNIASLRNLKGLSIIQLSEICNVSSETIQYMEDGEYLPSLPLALKVAKALNVKIEDLFKTT